MNTITTKLINDWSLTFHKDFTLYSSSEKYIILDGEQDILLHFSLQEKEILSITQSSWNAKFEINALEKTITLLTIPEEEIEEKLVLN